MEAVTQFDEWDSFISTPAPPVSFCWREIAVIWPPSSEIMWLTGRTEAWLTEEQQMIRPWLRFSPLHFHSTVIPGWCDRHAKSAHTDIRGPEILGKTLSLFSHFGHLLSLELRLVRFRVWDWEVIDIRNNGSTSWVYLICHLFQMLNRGGREGEKRGSLFSHSDHWGIMPFELSEANVNRIKHFIFLWISLCWCV